jgi:hypothetical protein
MRPSRSAAVVLAALATAGTAAAAGSMVTPGTTLVQVGDVTPLGLTGRNAVFGVGTSPAECRVKLWSLSKRTVATMGLPRSPSCTVETSTGSGIATVSVASSRVVWLAYTGGNTREWSLFTATPRAPEPQRLRFASRSVDGPAPIVLGQGTPSGVPYAVNREILFLAENGTRAFRVVAPAAVQRIAAGPGPNGIRVVALTADGHILALAADGAPAADDIVPDGPVKALGLIAGGVAYQVGTSVHVVGPAGDTTVELPGAATMVDAAAGRILYQRTGSLGAVTIAGGADVPLVTGTRAKPALGQLEPAGLAWAKGPTVNWRPGPLPQS